jgi:hypothetical protein
MTTRSRRETMTFKHPFYLKDVGRTLPAGTYVIVSEDELIEELSFPRYRRTGCFIIAPAEPPFGSSEEMIQVDARELDAAERLDRAADQAIK